MIAPLHSRMWGRVSETLSQTKERERDAYAHNDYIVGLFKLLIQALASVL